MRMANFILDNVDPILAEWELFARSVWPRALVDTLNDPAMLRDHAEDILRATAQDMSTHQTVPQQTRKSKGERGNGVDSDRVDKASELHGFDRVGSGFALWALIAEYRALRATVIRLWRRSGPEPDLRDLDDMTRFNESMDQSLAEAARSFSDEVNRERQAVIDGQARHAEELRRVNGALLESSVRQNEEMERADIATAALRVAKEEADKANRIKDDFLATLSHEIRTPLSAILGWSQILRRGTAKPEVLAEGLKTIERNARAQTQLIDDLLDMSRIISGKVTLSAERINLSTVVRAAIETVRPSASAKGIAIICDEATDSRCPILGDINRLQQVFWNLLTNAVKFTPTGGEVKIGIEMKQSRWQVDVIDTGEGISEEFVPHVFDRFRQADASTTRKHGGLGLGLSIVKQLVELHGGNVSVSSQGRGHGTTFTVALPVSALHDKSGLQAITPRHDDEGPSADFAFPVRDGMVLDAAANELRGATVLVVDDEPDARSLLKVLLEECGATVVLAASAAEAIEIIERDRPDVLVSDIGMPGEDGYSLLRRVRKLGVDRGGTVPAVALTAYARAQDRVKAVRAGFQLHVPKPVEPAELVAMVASLIIPCRP